MKLLLESVARSPEGRQAFKDITGIGFALEGERDTRPIVRVLMPTHSGGAKPQTNAAFEKMILASREVAIIQPEPSISSSVVHWVRNELLTRLYQSGKPFDWVLFLDDDIVPPPDAMLKLLGHGKDIVAAACTVRQDPPLPNFRTHDPVRMTYTTAFQWSGDGLLSVGAVGTGMMLISRKALEAVADYYIRCEYEKRYLLAPMIEDADGNPIGFQPFDEAQLPEFLRNRLNNMSYLRSRRAEETKNGWWFQFLQQPFADGEWGEDISFCFKARQCGFEVYVDTTVRCGHVGSYLYGLDDYLSHQKEVIQQQVPVGQRVTDEVAALVGEEDPAPCPA